MSIRLKARVRALALPSKCSQSRYIADIFHKDIFQKLVKTSKLNKEALQIMTAKEEIVKEFELNGRKRMSKLKVKLEFSSCVDCFCYSVLLGPSQSLRSRGQLLSIEF